MVSGIQCPAGSAPVKRWSESRAAAPKGQCPVEHRGERAFLRPESADFKPEGADFRSERADFGPNWADFRPQRAELRLRAWGMFGQMDEQKHNLPLCSTGH